MRSRLGRADRMNRMPIGRFDDLISVFDRGTTHVSMVNSRRLCCLRSRAASPLFFYVAMRELFCMNRPGFSGDIRV